MKKIYAILMALCILCAVCSAVADTEIPVFDNMPGVVFEDGETTVDETAFEGEWVLNAAFIDTEYIDPSTLSEAYGFNFMPFVIAGGKVSQDIQNENGEFSTEEMAYTFEAGQLQATDDNGMNYVFELLEDGNIVMSLFIPNEDGTNSCLSVFLMHPAE